MKLKKKMQHKKLTPIICHIHKNIGKEKYSPTLLCERIFIIMDIVLYAFLHAA
jgi:hypothetical protein